MNEQDKALVTRFLDLTIKDYNAKEHFVEIIIALYNKNFAKCEVFINKLKVTDFAQQGVTYLI